MDDPHIVLKLRHILFGCGLLGERPGQHELGFKYCSDFLHGAVEGRHHPWNGRMLDAALDVPDAAASIALVPEAVQFLGNGSKLNDEVTGKVFGFGLAPLLAPEANERCLVIGHYDPGVRTAKTRAAIHKIMLFGEGVRHVFFPLHDKTQA
jgi:hypothetical protein